MWLPQGCIKMEHELHRLLDYLVGKGMYCIGSTIAEFCPQLRVAQWFFGCSRWRGGDQRLCPAIGALHHDLCPSYWSVLADGSFDARRERQHGSMIDPSDIANTHPPEYQGGILHELSKRLL
jgi:hypothetical protein